MARGFRRDLQSTKKHIYNIYKYSNPSNIYDIYYQNELDILKLKSEIKIYKKVLDLEIDTNMYLFLDEFKEGCFTKLNQLKKVNYNIIDKKYTSN